MGYRIKYDSARERKFLPIRRKKAPKWVIIGLILVAFLSIFGNRAKDLLLPGDPEVTGAALSTLSEDLKDGKSFADAIHTFCTTIIDNAEITKN